MNLSILFYILAAICFFLACIDGWPWAGKMVPLGLLFFTLGHVVSGITFKAG